MRIRTIKTKNTTQYAIIKDINKNGKRTTCIYENLGTVDKFRARAGDSDPIEWLKKYVEDLNKKNKEETLPVIIQKNPNKIIEKNTQTSFNVGYLFLQDIYYKLGINNICNLISDKHQFKFDLNEILSKLIYSRILFPASKLKTLELSKKLLEQPTFDYQHIERALPVICEEMDFIQSELYKSSCQYMERNNKVLFYDCTNYYFEIEEESGLRQYGKSKENRPNPIVQMGMFMDGNGIPLAFDITSGNTNEQITLKPLEEKIINDFNTSEFVVCTDAGLASMANRKFNNTNYRKFITTQSLKKLKAHLKTEALDLTKGWHLANETKTYNISNLRTDENLKEQYKDKVFYKERWINEDGLEQRLIITYSVKYQEYQNELAKFINDNEHEFNIAKNIGVDRYLKEHVFRKPIPEGPFDTQVPGICWDNMVVRIVSYSISGVLWYQGESNTRITPYGHKVYFNTLMETLVREWRKAFNDKELPFYTVQLAAYDSLGSEKKNWSEIRAAQEEFAKNKNIYMITAIDIGEKKNNIRSCK